MARRDIKILDFEEREDNRNSNSVIIGEASIGKVKMVLLAIFTFTMSIGGVTLAESEWVYQNPLLNEIIMNAMIFFVMMFCFPLFFLLIFKNTTVKSSSSLQHHINTILEEYNLKLGSGFNMLKYFLILSCINLIGRGIYVVNVHLPFLGDSTWLTSLLWFVVGALPIVIVWGITHDTWYIDMEDGYHVKLDLRMQTYIHMEEETDEERYLFRTVEITMTSNRLGLKLNRTKMQKYREIANEYQLIKEGRWGKSSYMNPFIHFYDFTLISSFNLVFLNFVAALIDWLEKGN